MGFIMNRKGLLMDRKKKMPLRMCLGCRVHKDKKELIRVVRTPEGAIELDTTGRKAGRGAYICSDVICLKKAIKGKVLEKSLQRPIPQEIVTRLVEKMDDVP